MNKNQNIQQQYSQQQNYQSSQSKKFNNLNNFKQKPQEIIKGRNIEYARAKCFKDYDMLFVPPKEILYQKLNEDINYDVLQDIKVKINDQYTEESYKQITKFENIPNINKNLLHNLIDQDKCNYKNPFLVQQFTIPIILNSRDVKVKASTGQGKTNAFAIPIVQMIIDQKEISQSSYDKYIKCLIILPTRELAQQTIFNIFKLIQDTSVTACCVYGGQNTNIKQMAQNLQKIPDILIATPGKLQYFIDSKQIDLSRISYVVIDEADRCFDNNFKLSLENILDKECKNENKQVLMFSATYEKDIEKICQKQLKHPVIINIENNMQDIQIEQQIMNTNVINKYNDLIDTIQQFYKIYRDQIATKQKIDQDLVKSQLSVENQYQIIIFCNEKVTTSELYEAIEADLILPDCHFFICHGDLEQTVRTKNVNEFKKQDGFSILFATDALQRGMDFQNVKLIIQFDAPKSIQDYIQRIGRGSRKGIESKAICFFDGKETPFIRKQIQQIVTQNIEYRSKINTKENTKESSIKVERITSTSHIISQDNISEQLSIKQNTQYKQEKQQDTKYKQQDKLVIKQQNKQNIQQDKADQQQNEQENKQQNNNEKSDDIKVEIIQNKNKQNRYNKSKSYNNKNNQNKNNNKNKQQSQEKVTHEESDIIIEFN